MKVIELLGWITFFSIIAQLIFFPKDDSDKSFFNRSGLSIYIDHRTGNHYLKAGWFGSITPRLDREGNQIHE